MYSYLFNIYQDQSPIMSILLKAEDRFTCYESIFVKAGGEQEEWKANKEALWDIKDTEVELFFCWLETQRDPVPCSYHRSCFAPYALYKLVKSTPVYDITVETNEPIEDFGDPGTYFDDPDDPNVVY